MRNVTLTALSTLMLLAAPALASEPDASDKSEKPVTQKDVSPTDVIATPATDLNIKKDEIPPLLIAAEQRPYTLRGLSSCQQIAGAINALDGVLGEDVDLPQAADRRMKPGRVAQSVVGSFIPFRGVIRELSGANEHDRQLQAAILTGVARRSFLKGIGQGRGCRYPARAATLDVFNQRRAELNSGERPAPRQASSEPRQQPRESGESAGSTRYVSRPMVQRTD